MRLHISKREIAYRTTVTKTYQSPKRRLELARRQISILRAHFNPESSYYQKKQVSPEQALSVLETLSNDMIYEHFSVSQQLKSVRGITRNLSNLNRSERYDLITALFLRRYLDSKDLETS